jgi:hypothetical protein
MREALPALCCGAATRYKSLFVATRQCRKRAGKASIWQFYLRGGSIHQQSDRINLAGVLTGWLMPLTFYGQPFDLAGINRRG